MKDEQMVRDPNTVGGFALKPKEVVTMPPTCPKCGSNYIVQWNTVYASYPVGSIGVNGYPDAYGVADVMWDTAEAVEDESFQCKDCGQGFDDFDHQRRSEG